MLDEETTSDTVISEAEPQRTRVRTRGVRKPKHVDEEFEKNTHRIGDLIKQEEELDRASDSSANSDFFNFKVKKNHAKKNLSPRDQEN